MSRSGPPRRAGFTLVEALVALAITALVLAALAGTVTASLRARDAATARLDRVATARTVLLHLERELVTTLPERFAVAPPPRAALRFTGGDGGGERITYTLDGDALVRRVAPRFAPEDAPASATVDLLRGVERLDLRALAAAEWTNAWEGTQPPRAVAVTLVVAGERLETVVPIPTGRAEGR